MRFSSLFTPYHRRKHRSQRAASGRSRTPAFEPLEQRLLFNADPIWVGGVYVEEDRGSDEHGDTFYISFAGGAEGTKLTQVIIDGDQTTPGFSVGDNFFDTADSGLGADKSFAFKIERFETADPNARVTAEVVDGSMKLVLNFEHFHAGDLLVFSIDVDEVEFWDPAETDLSVVNSGFDPITSGVEFQTSRLSASFTAPHYENIDGATQYWNAYDGYLEGSNLNLPGDDQAGLRDRTAGTAFSLTQTPKPISIAGTVYVDNNLNLARDAGEAPLAGVGLELFRLENGSFVSTGHRATTNASGGYSFGIELGLMPGTYEVRETQPTGYFSVGAVPGVLNTGVGVGAAVASNADVLTQIVIPLGDLHATQLNFAEAQPAAIRGYVYQDLSDDGVRAGGEAGIAGVEIRLESISTVAGTVVRTTQTASDGSYAFENLPPGRYRIVEVAQPAAFFDGKDTAGTVAGAPRGRVVVNDVINEIDLFGADAGVEFNFGELPPGSISGHVCIVNPGYDCDSTDPAAKSPLPGVTVQLVDSSGAVIRTAQTNAQGQYLFDNLPQGIYAVREITPAGVIEGEAHIGTIGSRIVGSIADGSFIEAVELRPGQDGIDYDFCELPPASISGHVFEDVMDDGVRDVFDPMLADVRVDLFDSTGALVATTTTNAAGYYTFGFLRPGTYRLRESTPAGYFDGGDIVGTISGNRVGVSDSAADTISQIALPSGMHGVDYDFGEVRPGKLAGRVIVDVNDNNRVDAPAERPLAGVRIDLLDAAGGVIRTTTTDANGEYCFLDVRPGVYAVRETQPEGYFDGRTYVGSHGGDASQPDNIRSIRVDSGDNLTDYDFTEIPPGDIAGNVFIDTNGDCLVQPGERPLAGVKVELLNAAGNVLQTALTAADGTYKFTGLRPGQYAVRETQPAGYYQGGHRAGSGGGDASVEDLIRDIPIAGGQSLVAYNFCELEPASIGGQVYVDRDMDCVRDPGEEPLVGVVIELLDDTGRLVTTQSTDAAGRYRFDNLRPGRYSVREIQPANYFHGGQTAPAGRADSQTDDLLANVNLAGGERLSDFDFCEVPPATISGYVFQDGPVIVNETGEVPEVLRPLRSGQRDASDKPLAGVQLELRTVTGRPFPADRALPGSYAGDAIRVWTDANGYFEFTGLRGGSYHIYEVQPDGYVDGLDTPGTTGGVGVNAEDAIDPLAANLLSMLTSDAATDPHNDAILLVQVAAGGTSQENNFSEVLVRRQPPSTPIPPIDPPKISIDPPLPPPYVFPQSPIVIPPAAPPAYGPDLLIAGAAAAEYTWHLSIINSGTPRGSLNATRESKASLASQAIALDVYHWTVASLRDAQWRFVATGTGQTKLVSRNAFDVPAALALTGDFNGDRVDELALFLEGEWLIDLNGNGRWDDSDMWAKLGEPDDLPVIGDWDGDGKDDIGVFGPEWEGDDEAISREAGLPDSENRRRVKPKNVPLEEDEIKLRRRYLQRSTDGLGRSDVIDHVFRQGVREDVPIAGDFNGDGISTVGIYRSGKWRLDTNGDGKWNARSDQTFEFGRGGDIPVVGDFDGDGIDDVAIIRGDRMIIDSNRNGVEDMTDRVFMLEGGTGEYIVGDFDGDGVDEPALHRRSSLQRPQRVAGGLPDGESR